MSNGSGVFCRPGPRSVCIVSWRGSFISGCWWGLQVPCRSKSNGTALGLAPQLPWTSHPAGLCDYTSHLPSCPERSPQGHLGNALGQGCGSVLPKTSQLGGSTGVTGKAVASNPLDISPHRRNPQAHLWLGYGQAELAEAGRWTR